MKIVRVLTFIAFLTAAIGTIVLGGVIISHIPKPAVAIELLIFAWGCTLVADYFLRWRDAVQDTTTENEVQP